MCGFTSAVTSGIAGIVRVTRCGAPPLSTELECTAGGSSTRPKSVQLYSVASGPIPRLMYSLTVRETGLVSSPKRTNVSSVDCGPTPRLMYCNYVARVTLVGAEALSSVWVMAVAEPSSFLIVTVVPEVERSMRNCRIANSACATVGATPAAA